MTLLPAVLTLMGHKIHSGTLPTWKVRRSPRIRRAASTSRLRSAGIMIGLVVVFGAMAYPLSDIRLEVPTASVSILPTHMDSRQGIDQLRKDIGTEGLFPIQVVLTSKNSQQLLAAVGSAATISRQQAQASSVQSVSTIGLPAAALQQASSGDLTGLPPTASAVFRQMWTSEGGHLVARVVVLSRADPESEAAHNLVRALRKDVPPAVARSVVFQWVFNSPVNSVTPLLLFAIMFGLSMDYMVIMIS